MKKTVDPRIYLEVNFQHLYPDIVVRWFEKRVIFDLESGIKEMILIQSFYQVNALSIIDVVQGKICHFSVGGEYRGDKLTGLYLLRKVEQRLFGQGHSLIHGHGSEQIIGDWPDFANQATGHWERAAILEETYGRDSDHRASEIKVVKMRPPDFKSKKIITP